MTRSQMIRELAAQTGCTEAQTEAVLDAFVDAVADCLQNNEKVTISGFGRFEMRDRKAKAYTNPKTKVASELEPSTIPGFKASGLFKKRVMGK